MKLLLTNCTIHNADSDTTGNILIEDGVIKAITTDTPEADETVDCTGKHVVPGLIDMHVHFRDPGLEYKEDIESGSIAAVAGGVTTVCPMANTKPVNDNAAITKFMVDKADDLGLIDLFPVGCITKKMAGEELVEMGDMLEAGCRAFSDDGLPVMNSEVMRRALEYARQFGTVLISHAEDKHLAGEGVINDGEVATVTGLKGIPAEAEEVMVARDILLAKLTGGRIHIAHTSTKGTIELVRWGKQQGIAVTCEATPHHFTFTEEMCRTYDTNTKMNPPLRTALDVEAIREGLKDGTIDCIATDHAPHHRDEKFVEFDNAAFGITGLQTLVPLTLQLVKDAGFSWNDFVRLTSAAPARILGLDDRGSIAEGKLADIAVIDPDMTYTFDASVNRSKSSNTPLFGKELTGMAVLTVKNGEVVFNAEESA